MKNLLLNVGSFLTAAILFISCNNEKTVSPSPEPGSESGDRFVIASSPIGSSGVADYLLTTSDLSQGIISTIGQGIEQDGTYRYYMTHKGNFFSLLYGQGNPGAVTTYRLDEKGELEKFSDFQSETVQVFAAVNDDILTIKVPRSGDENASWFRINAQEAKIVGEGKINIVALAGNGERAHFTWAQQVGDKVFAPFMSIKGAAPDVFGTSFPDSSWIAVYDYPGMQLQKVIKDNRTGVIGTYFNNGILVDEKGDTYAFSAAVSTNSGKLNGKNPSAFVKIKHGTTEFDSSYFFNMEEVSGGKKVIGATYLSQGNVLVYMLSDPANQYGPVRMARINLYNKSFAWVGGVPEEILSKSASYNNNTITEDGKKVFVGINTEEGSWVYSVDIEAAQATKGLKVEGGKITAIVKMDR
ncbi:DUF4374 domain-containing protein [Dyadobacter tibetensis]|uniref:DUF4374 domain-containing protein n=1 Tax=Dyadobacter tibetensis TaxID=1211851 RepID=UPI00046E68EA|nr:DUF4374 domain-containing protein [Dyadobacter tibetensis]